MARHRQSDSHNSHGLAAVRETWTRIGARVIGDSISGMLRPGLDAVDDLPSDHRPGRRCSPDETVWPHPDRR